MDGRLEPQGRTMTLWEQLSTRDPAIRDVLKTPQDEDNGGSGDADRRPCTLMDAICRESRGESGAGMINWKPLRDRLLPRRPANACSPTTSDHRPDQEDSQEGGEGSTDAAPAAASMSLMALLEQADNQWDDDDNEEETEEDGDASASSSKAVVGEEEEEDGEGREEEMVRPCCVCMVRHKGAAFIPCGHTFCRPCSRELWLTRASCPLCNAFVHDILHIF